MIIPSTLTWNTLYIIIIFNFPFLIEFVINPSLQQKFEDKKAEFKETGIPDEEVFAYHGTPPENIKSICKSNLNIIRRTAHGGGYYFSEHPEMSLG